MSLKALAASRPHLRHIADGDNSFKQTAQTFLGMSLSSSSSTAIESPRTARPRTLFGGIGDRAMPSSLLTFFDVIGVDDRAWCCCCSCRSFEGLDDPAPTSSFLLTAPTLGLDVTAPLAATEKRFAVAVKVGMPIPTARAAATAAAAPPGVVGGGAASLLSLYLA